MGEIDVTIVVCTCNRAAMLPQAIVSLLDQQNGGRFSYEVLIVDDGSTDNTAQVVASLSKNHPGARLRYNYKRAGGVADARNFGISAAAGEWIAFFDDDQLADPQWLAALMETARERNAGCVGGSLDLLLPESNRFALGRRTRRLLGERDFGAKTGRYPRLELPGAGNVLIDKSVVAVIGGFDTRMREGGSDTEFFARLSRAGIKPWYSPKARVWHVIPPSRLTPGFLRWLSRKTGNAAVRRHHKNDGILTLFFWIAARLFFTLARDLPLALYAYICGKQEMRLDCLCAIGFTVGYLRGGLYLLAPRLFEQKKFRDYLDFRRHGGERAAQAEEY